ncbi:hypothetical protein B9Z55_023783 [Caenorhabditis nigoni]|nr:hypothetical protein B9Z55_023783 [Caenorhabditis nigoni]
MENHTFTQSDAPSPSNRRPFRHVVERFTPIRFGSTQTSLKTSSTFLSRNNREIAERQTSTSFSPQSNSTVQENGMIPTSDEMELDENSNESTSMSLQNEPQVTDNLQTRRMQTPFGGSMDTRRYSRADLIRVMRGDAPIRETHELSNRINQPTTLRQRPRASAVADREINELFHTMSDRGVENFNPQDLTDFNERYQMNVNYGVMRLINLQRNNLPGPPPPEEDNEEAD